MSVTLDDTNLSQRASSGGQRSGEIRAILWLSVTDKRNLVELEIPGSSGNLLQDMGADPVLISYEGEIAGENAEDTMEALLTKYQGGKPIPFHSDLSALADVNQVVIANFESKQVSASASRYHYKIDLKESRA